MRPPWTARIAAAGAVASGLIALAAQAQEATKTKTQDRPETGAATQAPTRTKPSSSSRFKTRQALNDHYEKEFADLDRKRISDLAALAPTLEGPEAEATYSDAFNLAVTRDQYDAAEKAAEAFLDSGAGSPQTKALASFVNIIAASNRGEYDQAVKDLDLFLKGVKAATPAAAADPAAKAATAASTLDPSLIFAVGEAFLQRLIAAREYDVARKVCTTFVDNATDPNVKQHFAGRLARIDMLGKAAPAIAGTDVDGKKVSLADYKGKVVLVDFWATWAPPCVAQMPYYNALQKKYGPQGFQILGVNVDGANQNARDKAAVTNGVRRFLLSMSVAWPSVMSGTAANDFAGAYGVTDIPANFLVGRDGKIVQVELSDTDLDKAIEKAVGGAKAGKPASDAPEKAK